MRQVEVVNAADQRGDAVLLEGCGEGHDEGGFADALDAVEADDEGRRLRRFSLLLLLVQLEAV